MWRDDEMQSYSNISAGGNVSFVEMRPFLSTYYYVLVVTQGQVMFDLSLDFYGCKLIFFDTNWYILSRLGNYPILRDLSPK